MESCDGLCFLIVILVIFGYKESKFHFKVGLDYNLKIKGLMYSSLSIVAIKVILIKIYALKINNNSHHLSYLILLP